MKIESVDFFYVAMPDVTTAVDGSQDALLVRVRAGDYTGWGECEAAPLPSIAAYMCPMSHGACQPVSASVLGAAIRGPDDIEKIAANIETVSQDLLQAPHTWSGIEMALWDLLGRARGQPVWKLLGFDRAHPKTPYASVLMGDDAQDTLVRARNARNAGFQALKIGWGPYGSDVGGDADQVMAAREGLGPDGILLVDAGQVFGGDVDRVARRFPGLQAANVAYFEEPFSRAAFGAYAQLSKQLGAIKLAGGEASHSWQMAVNLMTYGHVKAIQVDCGRVGGIGAARRVAQHATACGVQYINHTFTSNLALSASLQPFAGCAEWSLCEFPTELSPLARELTRADILPNADGLIEVPDAPGLGVDINEAALEKYGLDVRISVGGRELYRSPGSNETSTEVEEGKVGANATFADRKAKRGGRKP